MIRRHLLHLFFPALLLGLGTACVAPGSTGLLEDDFDYGEGPLVARSGGAWKSVRGAPTLAARTGHAVFPGAAEAEAVAARAFAPPPPGAAVEAEFLIRFDPPEGSTTAGELGVFLQFTAAEGLKRRGRLALRLAEDGTARLGVTSRLTEAIVWAPNELAPAEDHLVRLRYESAAGRTLLWVNPPDAPSAPSAETTDPDAITPGRLALQQNPRPTGPELRLARLRVHEVTAAPTRADVAAPGDSAPSPEPFVIPPPRERFLVFLLVGQSNMAGRGKVGPEDDAADPRILALGRDGRWRVARDPLHWDKPASTGVGPGLPFARTLLAGLPPDTSIGLIPAAFGGSSISWWKKDYEGAQRWPDGQNYYRHAVAAARAAAAQGRLAGILWNQGESDQGRARADGGQAYRRQLHALIRDLRADLDAPDLPFVAATLGPWHAANAEAFNAVMLALPAEVPHTATVNTLAPEVIGQLRNKPDDPPHYDTPSVHLLGRLYAREISTLLRLD